MLYTCMLVANYGDEVHMLFVMQKPVLCKNLTLFWVNGVIPRRKWMQCDIVLGERCDVQKKMDTAVLETAR